MNPINRLIIGENADEFRPIDNRSRQSVAETNTRFPLPGGINIIFFLSETKIIPRNLEET